MRRQLLHRICGYLESAKVVDSGWCNKQCGGRDGSEGQVIWERNCHYHCTVQRSGAEYLSVKRATGGRVYSFGSTVNFRPKQVNRNVPYVYPICSCEQASTHNVEATEVE